jgi:hypothetical protein
MKLIVTGLFVSSLAIAPAFAQTSSEGSVRGRALDEQGAVLPGVSITATSPDVGGRYSTISDGVGEYRLLNLPA